MEGASRASKVGFRNNFVTEVTLTDIVLFGSVMIYHELSVICIKTKIVPLKMVYIGHDAQNIIELDVNCDQRIRI